MEIDHVNLDKKDNRIANLRLATRSQNTANGRARRTCKGGERGVFWCITWHKWKVAVTCNGKHYISYASHKISAILAARLIRREIHGKFAA